jgi:hypothetical protein
MPQQNAWREREKKKEKDVDVDLIMWVGFTNPKP